VTAAAVTREWSSIDQLDEALEAYVRLSREQGRDPQGFTSKTIRVFVNRIREKLNLPPTSPIQLASMLQYYRFAQAQRVRGQTPRYVIASRGYGTATRWFILAKPGSDPATVRHARLQQAEWAIEDMARRWASDVAHEIAPALRDAVVDEIIEDAVADVTRHVSAVREGVERRLKRVTRA
jgi:hypothetical protein